MQASRADDRTENTGISIGHMFVRNLQADMVALNGGFRCLLADETWGNISRSRARQVQVHQQERRRVFDFHVKSIQAA